MTRREHEALRNMAIEYIRRIMKRRSTHGDNALPEECLFIDIILQAMQDVAGVDVYLHNDVRKEAEEFFLDGRCEFLCELLGLDYDFVISLKKDLVSGKIVSLIKIYKWKA